MAQIEAAGARSSDHGQFDTRIVARRRLASEAFELELARPAGFAFLAGQRIRLSFAGSRVYSEVFY